MSNESLPLSKGRKDRRRIQGEERQKVEAWVRSFGVKRMAELMNVHYATLNQKLTGYSHLYEEDIRRMEEMRRLHQAA